jgi:hypothetical protein
MDREALCRRLKSQMDQLVDELLASENPPRTIDEIEAAALRLREKAGQRIAEELARAAQAEAQAKEGSPKKVACSCGRWARHRGERERDVVTMAGRLRVRRSYYYCRLCDKGFCPGDVCLGLCGSAFTRRVQQEVVRLDALLPYHKAVELLWDLAGVSVSAKEAQRLLARGEALVETYQQARWAAAAADLLGGKKVVPDVVYLLADGVQTPILGGWREMKVGLARQVDGGGRALGPTRYVSLLGEAEPFGWEWAGLAEGVGVAHARLVVVLADGAKWIWNQTALHFPDAIQILDVWHATQRLWEVGRLAFLEEEARTQWVQARQAELWQYQTDALLWALASVAKRCEPAREKAQETMGYYHNNRERMDYPRYEKLGLQVGSGPVESGCKQVVTQRLKGAGMRWREAGAQTVARLRCLLLGGEWNLFIRHWNQQATAHAF